MSPKKNNYFIGCSGFSERLWKWYFYPESLSSRKYLAYYSTKLNAVEINSTFYHKPLPSTLKRWYEVTPEDFGFFLKIPKRITHTMKLDHSKEEIEEFCRYTSDILWKKLKGFLFQLPPSFKNTPENIERIITNIPSRYTSVIEFRDWGWWTQEVFDTLREHSIICSGVSIPRDIPEDVIINNSNTLYYRLHGKPKMFSSPYTHEYLDALFDRVQKFEGEKYIFFNNTYWTAAVENALYLTSKI